MMTSINRPFLAWGSWVSAGLPPLVILAVAFGLACGNGGGSSGGPPLASANRQGNLLVNVSSENSDNWAQVTTKILQVELLPQDAAAPPVTLQPSAPGSAIELAQPDQTETVLTEASIPGGTYTGAVVTLGANPGDLSLMAAAQTSAGFPGAPGTSVAADHIQIQGATGNPGSLTVSVRVLFASALTVMPAQNAVLNLEFVLAAQGLLTPTTLANDPDPLWAVNFQGILIANPAALQAESNGNITGTGASVAADGSYMVINQADGSPLTCYAQTSAYQGSFYIHHLETFGGSPYDAFAQARDFNNQRDRIVGFPVTIAPCWGSGQLGVSEVWINHRRP